MSRIPYYVEKITTDQIRKVNDFALALSNHSTQNAYDLKQIVPITDEDGTSELYAIYELNNNLIYTNLKLNEEICDNKYLTADQIRLIEKIGVIEFNGDSRKVKKVIISCNDEKFDISATIELEEI